MNYPILKFIPALALLAACNALHAQEVVGHSTDSNYFNTTIVYKKGNIDDQSVLQKIENNYGMGDVIRIADAPTAPPSETAVPTIAILQNTLPVSAPAMMVQEQVAPKPQVEIIQNNVKESTKNTPEMAAKVSTKQVAAKSARVKSSKSVKRQKVRYKAPVKRKKHGKQRYGCPKF